MFVFVHLVVILNCFLGINAARILAVFPTPSISHQVVFRPLTQELARRGHEVTVITPDPVYTKGKSPENLTEIDVHDISYTIWKEKVLNSDVTSGQTNDLHNQLVVIYNLITEIFEVQMNTVEVQALLKDKTIKFDLLILESLVRPALGLTHIYEVPVIQISSMSGFFNSYEAIGAPVHPLLYPIILRQKINNLTTWDKVKEIYNHYVFENIIIDTEKGQNAMIRRIFGDDVPLLSELYNRIDMLFLNSHPLWDSNRPVPPSVIYLGGIHRNPEKELPKDMKSYLDSSMYGVIYISFGTNVSPSALPSERIRMLIQAFSGLPYDVLWKWDKDELPGRSSNIKISKWLPQSDLLRHQKVKLFITQGGLQSTDEAIAAGVPMIGIPMLGDQWYNVEHYVRHKIGLRLDMETLTADKLKDAIDTILKDDSYRQNVIKLRALMSDQPQQPLSRAVWWTEYVLRHRGARHLRSPAANISWTDYLELELISYLLLGLLLVIFLFVFVIYYCIVLITNICFSDRKQKRN